MNKEYYLINSNDIPILDGTAQDRVVKWSSCRSIVVYINNNQKNR